MTSTNMRTANFLLISSLLLATTSARADEAAKPKPWAKLMVLEAHVGRRGPEVGPVLTPVITGLRREGVLVGAGAKAAIEGSLSQSLPVASPGDFVKASDTVAKGYDAFIEGEYPTAIRLVESAIAVFNGHPVEARDEKIRVEHHRALTVLAFSQQQTGATDKAVATMIELLRTFPERPVTTMEYSPDVVKLFRNAKAMVARGGLGSLTVRADDPASVIFVNERFAGTGQATLRDVIPGTYRVLTLTGDRRGRLHLVNVHSGSEAQIELSVRLETSLQSDDFNGFVFASDSVLARDETPLSVRVARDAGAELAVVLSVREVDGIRAIVGSVYNVASGSLVRRGVIALEPTEPSEQKLRVLGQYLAGDQVSDPVLVTGSDAIVKATRKPVRYDDSARRSRRIIALSVGGAGLVSTGIGLYFGSRSFGQYEDSRKECPMNVCSDKGRNLVSDSRTSARISDVTIGVGLVGITAGALLWFTAPKPHALEGVQVAPIAGPDTIGAMVHGAF